MTEATQPLAEQKRQAKFRRWYANNREEFNAERRRKYATDAAVRKKARDNAKRNRQNRTEPDTSSVQRVVNGKTVNVYRVAAVGVMIGRSPETIRTWIRNGWVPDPDDGWTHRTYTKKQVTQLKRLAHVIEEYRYAKNYQARIDKVVASIATRW